MGHNACKSATTVKERKSPLTCQLCASDSTASDDKNDYLFRSYPHPLRYQARAESDSLLLTTPLPTVLDRCLFPVLLRLVLEKGGH